MPEYSFRRNYHVHQNHHRPHAQRKMAFGNPSRRMADNRNWNGFNTWPEYDHKPTKEEVDVFARELFKAMFGVEPIFIGMEDDEYEYDSRAGL